MERLLDRTSENYSSTHSAENCGEKGAELTDPVPFGPIGINEE
jgi:hypothetical protein